MGVMDLVRFASSDEMQNMIGQFNRELEDIHRDRTGLKAAMPMALADFQRRLDRIDGKVDDVRAELRAMTGMLLQAIADLKGTEPKGTEHVTGHTAGTILNGGTIGNTEHGVAVDYGTPGSAGK